MTELQFYSIRCGKYYYYNPLTNSTSCKQVRSKQYDVDYSLKKLASVRNQVK